MAAFSIEWHQRCLENKERSVEFLKADIERMTERLASQTREVNCYREQIRIAVESGKASFDRERYLVKRVGK